MESIVFCFSLLWLNIYLLRDCHQIVFFTESLCVCMKMKRKVLATKHPIKQLFVFQNAVHYCQIHDTEDIECELHLGLSFLFCSGTLTGRGTCYLECVFAFLLDV